jgi:hypothetical protein
VLLLGGAPDVLLLGGAPDVLLLELDCAPVQALTATAMTKAPAGTEPMSFRENIGELFLSMASSPARANRASGKRRGQPDRRGFRFGYDPDTARRA